VVAITLWPQVILAVAALITAIAGLLSAIAAIRRTKRTTLKDAEEECLERLRVARAEAESVASELHDRRMKEHLG
jgi:hypothetical protein